MSYTYSAFISYRHLPKDIAAAKVVQQALETYRIPVDIQRKIGRKKLNRFYKETLMRWNSDTPPDRRHM